MSTFSLWLMNYTTTTHQRVIGMYVTSLLGGVPTSIIISRSMVLTVVILRHLFGEHLVFCFVLPLSELFGSPELCQIHSLFWVQTLEKG